MPCPWQHLFQSWPACGGGAPASEGTQGAMQPDSDQRNGHALGSERIGALCVCQWDVCITRSAGQVAKIRGTTGCLSGTVQVAHCLSRCFAVFLSQSFCVSVSESNSQREQKSDSQSHSFSYTNTERLASSFRACIPSPMTCRLGSRPSPICVAKDWRWE